MKMSRLIAMGGGMVATIVSGHAVAQTTSDAPTTVATVLNTFSKVAVDATNMGPKKVEKNTGAGTMDANLAFKVISPEEVDVAIIYTRSANEKNNENSYMQGGVMVAKVTKTGVEMGKPFDLPILNGERAFMRPLIGFSEKGDKLIAIAASEDNGLNNNNPMPVAFVLNRTGTNLALQEIPNSTRGEGKINKPTNLIAQALKQNIKVQNPNDQRGPHSLVDLPAAGTFAVGMQYNNQANEAFSVTLEDNGAVKMNWLERYSNNARHCRPQIAFDAAANTLFQASVEANNQPAEIGIRLTAIDPATGNVKGGDGNKLNKIVVKSEPGKNRYVAEPTIGIVAGKIALGWAMTSKARNKGAGDKGHAGGGQVPQLALFSEQNLQMMGQAIPSSAPYGRHSHIFTTTYGPNAEPAVSYIGGSSTGTGPGKELLYPLKADGTLGVRDLGKMYTVGTFSDVANLQARGKRNPQDQARGFINGVGSMPNPGYGVEGGFMPEVKSFSASALTGYADAAAMGAGLKESIWLSLVPAAWKEGIQTVPGSPTEKPGINPDGTGSLPTVNTSSPTKPAGEETSVDGSNSESVVTGPELGTDGNNTEAAGAPGLDGAQSGGCSTSPRSSTSGTGMLALLGVGAALLFRRRRNNKGEV